MIKLKNDIDQSKSRSKINQRQIARVIACKEFLFDINFLHCMHKTIYTMQDIKISFSTLASFTLTIDCHTRVKSYHAYYDKVQKAVEKMNVCKVQIQNIASKLYLESIVVKKVDTDYIIDVFIDDVKHNMHYFSVEIVCFSGKFKRVFSYMDFLTHSLDIVENDSIDYYESVLIVD